MRSSIFLVSALQQCLDLGIRVDDLADGNIVVQRSDVVGQVLGAVYLVEPRAGQQCLCPVSQVCAEHSVNVSVLICLVELLQSVDEQTVSCIAEDTASLAFLQRIGDPA